MNRLRTLALAGLCLMSLPAGSARAGVFIGVGVPGPYYRPYYRPYYYGPRVVIAAPPVVVAPVAPVYVAPPPAPVYVTPAPVAIQAPAPPPAPAPAPPGN